MSVLKVELQGQKAETMFNGIEKYAEMKQLRSPSLLIELNAGAVSEQIGYVKQLLLAIAADDGISDKAKEEFTNFLAEISMSLKRGLQGGIHAGLSTTSSVRKGHALSAMSAVAAN